MARDSAIPTESFEEILAWLNPDRETAASMVVQLRHDLEKIFQWRGCSDPEGLTDEVFDRVAKKVHEVRRTYEGDPRLYFHAVANNLIKEDIKKRTTHLSLDEVDPFKYPLKQPEPDVKDETQADREECLESCLQDLSKDKQELIRAYYEKEKQAKIENRSELAREFGMSVQTLRVNVYRIRKSLLECIERCLDLKAQQR